MNNDIVGNMNTELRNAGIETPGAAGVAELAHKHEAALERVRELHYTIEEIIGADVNVSATYNEAEEKVDFNMRISDQCKVDPDELLRGFRKYVALLEDKVAERMEEVNGATPA